MFNKLKRKKNMFFGEREVVSVDELGNGKVTLYYKEFVGEVSRETMTSEEWRDGQTPAALEKPEERQAWFVKRTNSLRTKAALALFGDSPRYWDIPKIMVWISEGIKDAYGAAINANFGVKDFENEVKIDDVLKRVETTGTDVVDGLSDFEKSVVELIRKSDIKVWQMKNGNLFAKLTDKVTAHIDKAISLSFGVDDRHLRTDDIEKILKEYAKKNQDVQGSDSVGREGQAASAPTQPESEKSVSVETESPKGEPEKPVDGIPGES